MEIVEVLSYRRVVLLQSQETCCSEVEIAREVKREVYLFLQALLVKVMGRLCLYLVEIRAMELEVLWLFTQVVV
jgi:hypothetical protein